MTLHIHLVTPILLGKNNRLALNFLLHLLLAHARATDNLNNIPRSLGNSRMGANTSKKNGTQPIRVPYGPNILQNGILYLPLHTDED